MKKRNPVYVAILSCLSALVFLSATACAGFFSAGGIKPAGALLLGPQMPPETSQALVVVDDSFLFFTSHRVYALQKAENTWRHALDPIDAVIGRNGFASPGEKREGDGRTPSGLFRLGTAFGYDETIDTRLPYRRALPDDVWIDDVADPDYNRWVKQSQTRASSFESMRRADDLYKYGLVIEYNTDPVVPGRGSAIFFHVWAGPKSTTSGCVAVAEEDIRKILAWLDPAARPGIWLNPIPVSKEDP
ncbi:MAG: L,D-transpeptidase family protein [Smithellaceae bacterium]|nr:L,D-transpeptidase family protein [Syntrophaceae bacterium]MDD4241421.1 L,D-transpeptidase family protein [Smithellaceae bacterium]NLX50770.1 L,D-transpeptidase family protein [Deltaproteobacteria bacterium]